MGQNLDAKSLLQELMDEICTEQGKQAIREAMAKGAREAMSEKTYRGLDALIIMDRFGWCMTRRNPGSGEDMPPHRYKNGHFQYYKNFKWFNTDIEKADLDATDWRIVPDPAEPEAKPTPGPWAREFLTGIRDQINKFLEPSTCDNPKKGR